MIKLMNKINYFYNNLRYILYKEISKISDIDYRYELLDKLLNEKKMIKKPLIFSKL